MRLKHGVSNIQYATLCLHTADGDWLKLPLMTGEHTVSMGNPVPYITRVALKARKFPQFAPALRKYSCILDVCCGGACHTESIKVS